MPTYRIEGQIYEAETPDEAYAKHDQATKGAPAAPRAEKGMGTGQMLAQAMVNFPRSAYELGKSTFEAVTSPIETGKAVVDLGNSVLGKMGVTDASPEMADRVGKFYTNRYGSVENAKETFANDPAGFLADVATILTGGGAAVRQIPGAAKVGKAVERAGAAIDPLNVATKAVKGGGKVAAAGLGFTTGAGTRAVEEAAKAGYRGGEQGQAFVGQMRGTAPVTDVVETIKPAIASLREQRSKAYREGMAGVTKDKSVLKFNDIDNAINKVKGRGYFEGKSKDPAAASAWQELKTVVDDWKSGDPATYHTVEGVDALKQAVGSIRDSLPYNTPARNAANEVYSAIRGEITRQAPDYARVMSEYETASDLLNEISTTLSQNPKASIDTQVRKLQSILRNNANTNYGRRVELGEMLADQGASNLFPQLAGQAMSSFSPRGLSGALAGAGALYSTVPNLAQGLTPTGALQLASTSPRAVGEMAYAAGQVAGKPAQLAQLLAKHGDKLAQSNPQMAMAVDMARRAGGKVNPQTARLLAYQLAQFERATEE
jgi:hypothetical protein